MEIDFGYPMTFVHPIRCPDVCPHCGGDDIVEIAEMWSWSCANCGATGCDNGYIWKDRSLWPYTNPGLDKLYEIHERYYRKHGMYGFKPGE